MKVLLIFSTAMIFALSGKAQSDRKAGGINVSLGASAVYYYGAGDRNFDKFENDRVNWQINAMLGITLATDKNNRRTILAGFGGFGLNNSSTITRIFEDQGYVTTIADQSNTNSSYQVEGGLFIAEILRISTGVGQQVFNKQTIASSDGSIELDATSLRYNSTTVGFNFKLGAVGVNVNCNFNYGKDYNKTVIIPSAGLMVRL